MLILAVILVTAGVGVFLSLPNRPAEVPLEADLQITVIRSVKGSTQHVRIDEAAALPVRAGERMYMEVSYNQPACTYLVWFDSQGKAIPLYPWNMDSIEVDDLHQPPPVCLATNRVFNPMTISKGWQFGKESGLETVLLLAWRRWWSARNRLR